MSNPITISQIENRKPVLIISLLLIAVMLTIIPFSGQADDAHNSKHDPKLVKAEVSFEGPEVALDLIRFYRYLAKNNLLPTRDYIVPSLPKGQWLADALLNEGIIIRGKPEPELTYLLCDLNPANCTQKGKETEPVFTYNTGQTIKVPNLPLQAYQYHKALPSTITDSEVKEKAIVLGIPEESQKEIKQDLSAKANDKSILAKATGYSVEIDLPEDELNNKNSDLRKLASSSIGMFVSSERRVKVYEDHNNDISSTSTLDCNSSERSCEQTLWDIVKFDASHYVQSNNSSVIVGAIDVGLDKTHFDFQENGGQRNIFECIDKQIEEVKNSRDIAHGTAIVGIIAARKNGQGIIGLNPRATVAFYSAVNESEIPSKLDSAVNDNVKILNMSVGYKTQQGQVQADKFAQRLKNLGRNFLVVVAAGNEGVDLNDDCGLRIPICLYQYSNVLNVAALDKNEQFIYKSNYGSDVIHIAALGKDIPSDMPGGKTGDFSGTSAAAALVSGAASIIQQLNPHLEPDSIAQRLQYTADFLELEQEDKKLSSGRLNLQRAIEHLDEDTLVKVTDKSITICGTIKGAKPNTKIRFFGESETEDSIAHEIFVTDVRRISKISSNKFTIMGMYSENPAKPKHLKKWSSVTFIPDGSTESLPTNIQIRFTKQHPCNGVPTASQPEATEVEEKIDLNTIQELVRHVGP